MKRRLLLVAALLLCLAGCTKKTTDPMTIYTDAYQKMLDTKKISENISMDFLMEMEGMSLTMEMTFDTNRDYSDSANPKYSMDMRYSILGQTANVEVYLYEGNLYSISDGTISVEAADAGSLAEMENMMGFVGTAQSYLKNPVLTTEGSDQKVTFELDQAALGDILGMMDESLANVESFDVESITCAAIVGSDGNLKSMTVTFVIVLEVDGISARVTMDCKSTYANHGKATVDFPIAVTSGEYTPSNTPAYIQ